MAINTGVNVSKLVGYAVLAPPPGVNVTKANIYAVLGPPPGVNVTKANAYAVLSAPNVTPPSWTGISMVDGIVGIAYSQTWNMPLAAVPVTYGLASGSLPTGLSLSAITGNQAQITGIPHTAGSYTFLLTATNLFGTSSQSFTIIITSTLSLPALTLPSNFTGYTYSTAVIAVNGYGAYTFTHTSGTLPTGTSFNSSTGVISGTTTTVGTYTFSIQVTDAGGNTATQSYSITVTTLPSTGGNFGFVA